LNLVFRPLVELVERSAAGGGVLVPELGLHIIRSEAASA